MKPSDMNQEPVPLVRSRLKMLSMTLAGAPAPAPVAQVDHLADCLRAVLFLIRRDAPSLSGKALGLADAALQAYDTATAPVAQPVSQCSLKCTTECLARVHGCASECPALPWQPAAPAPVARGEDYIDRDEQMAELLRSACAIADRQGEGTHWRRFGDSIRALGLNGITARAYQVLPSDHEGLPVAPAPVAQPRMKERDPALPAEKQGLFRKFEVLRVDGSDQPGGKHHGCEYFVLDVDHDPHAGAALAAYADACKDTHPVLSAELAARFQLAAPAPVAQQRPAVSQERIREVFQMYGTGRLDGFTAAVRAIEEGGAA
jgi:hypothetical protein